MWRAGLILIASAATASAQPNAIKDLAPVRLAARDYLLRLEVPSGGFRPQANDPPTLPATSAALRALRNFGGKIPHPDKHAEFVRACYEKTSGAFRESPNGQASVYATSVGMMAVVELGLPQESFAQSVVYLKDHAKTFEEARIAAAAAEAWGLENASFPVDDWVKRALATWNAPATSDDPARLAGAVLAMIRRLGREVRDADKMLSIVQQGQRSDGGWGRANAKTSDLESTYRVIRGYVMLKRKPEDSGKVFRWVLSCQNPDGGFGLSPGEKSSAAATYFAAMLLRWLEPMSS